MNVRIFGSALCLFLFLIACKDDKKHTEGFKYTNDLIDETSPYLLQHAHNPVNWKPWDEKVFAQAEKEDKLVVVSIGYSSCHWCHVMEEETFENEDVAQFMNETFINVKVDREERPDVDQVYMTALQLVKGSGGWPLNVILLPNKQPLYMGTYHSTSEWQKALADVNKFYHDDKERAYAYAEKVAQGVQSINIVSKPTEDMELSKEIMENAMAEWKPRWDTDFGGDQGQQKFMLPANLELMMNYAALTGDKETLTHLERTLDKMALGGIYDQIGGGFFRYSTDPHWKVPHFEKMLYDNAQLVGIYARAYTMFEKPLYKDVVYGTVGFLQREMFNEKAGYYAALDADSQGGEGAYYVWKKENLQQILGGDFEEFKTYFNITEKQVWENGNYVLQLNLPKEVLTKRDEYRKFAEKKSLWSQKLMAERTKIERPGTDDKIITSWNALLISGLVDAYWAFQDEKMLLLAEETHQLVKAVSVDGNSLSHTYKIGDKRDIGFMEDYAFWIAASLKLYQASLNQDYLKEAQNLTHQVNDKFWDDEMGMYQYNIESSELIAKLIKTDDGVIPSPNSVMATNLNWMGHLFYDVGSMKKANNMMASMAPMVSTNPDNYAKWSSLILNTTYPYYEVAVVGENAAQLAFELNSEFSTNVLVVGTVKENEIALFKERFEAGNTLIYVCQDHACKLPVENTESALKQIENF
jgi:uncharacterized protein YyaL (SSP411 family)